MEEQDEALDVEENGGDGSQRAIRGCLRPGRGENKAVVVAAALGMGGRGEEVERRW